jgi:hypothetical protein
VAIAQVATPNDAVQDTHTQVENSRQDVAAGKEYARQDQLTTQNTSDIEDLTSNQKFIVQVLQIILPLLSLVATGVIAIMQLKAKGERHALADESRSNLSQMARSINGMKGQLVATTEAKAFLEGVAMYAAKSNDPALTKLVQERAAALNVKVEQTAHHADTVAEEAAVSIEAIPPEVKAIHP